VTPSAKETAMTSGASEHTQPVQPSSIGYTSPLTLTEVRALVAAAGMAPSVFNTQPWSFRLRGATIELHADLARMLRGSIDPDGRQLVVSCGAALLNLRVAAAHLGRPVQVDLVPQPEHETLLARVDFGEPGHLQNPDAQLYPAVRRRHTYRRPFAPRQIPGSVLGELAEAVHSEHANLVPVGSTERRWLYDLVALSELLLEDSPRYGDDLARWTAGSTARDDGLPVETFGSLPANGEPPMRDFGFSHWLTPPHEHYGRDPWLAIITTPSDDKRAWLQAGQAVERLLLVACARGLAASFLNQPLDDASVRRDLASRTLGGYPQMILRLGYGRASMGAPRRLVDDLLIAGAAS